MSIITIRCPSCKKEIQVDDSVGIGFCMYCGNKVSTRNKTNLKVRINKTESFSNVDNIIREHYREKGIQTDYNKMLNTYRIQLSELQNWKVDHKKIMDSLLGALDNGKLSIDKQRGGLCYNCEPNVTYPWGRFEHPCIAVGYRDCQIYIEKEYKRVEIPKSLYETGYYDNSDSVLLVKKQIEETISSINQKHLENMKQFFFAVKEDANKVIEFIHSRDSVKKNNVIQFLEQINRDEKAVYVSGQLIIYKGFFNLYCIRNMVYSTDKGVRYVYKGSFSAVNDNCDIIYDKTRIASLAFNGNQVDYKRFEVPRKPNELDYLFKEYVDVFLVAGVCPFCLGKLKEKFSDCTIDKCWKCGIKINKYDKTLKIGLLSLNK